MSSYDLSWYLFIFLEFVQLILILTSLFIRSKFNTFILWSGCLLAGIKFSISAFLSIDIITYEAFYKQLGNSLEYDISTGMEIGFVSLLYLAKALHLPLIFVHVSLVIFFLVAVNNFFSYLLPKEEANTLTLIFCLIPMGGELCIYLLRQLASTSFVVLALSIALKSKNIAGRIGGLITFLLSLLFHVSSFIYFPFFLATFIKKRSLKVLLIVVCYVLIIGFFFLPSEVFLSSTEDMGGENYTDKYKNYSKGFDDRNDATIGGFNIAIVAYLLWCMTTRFNQIKDSKIFSFACSSLLIFVTYLITELNGALWMSSRIKFLASAIVLSSDMILTTNFIIKSQVKLYFSLMICLLFGFSIFYITKAHAINSLFRIQF
jgi:hypothetical protein